MFRGLVLLLFILIPAPASALRGPHFDVRVQPLPETLRAGETVVLSWGELPEDIEEMELLLSLDDGRRFAIRVSPELEGRSRSYRWRVPNLPAERARLMIRGGGEHGEREGVPSEAFRIQASASEPPELDPVCEGILWMGFERGGHAELPGGDLTSGARLTLANAGPVFSFAPDAPTLHRPRPARRAESETSHDPLTAPPRAPSSTAARRLPLRN